MEDKNMEIKEQDMMAAEEVTKEVSDAKEVSEGQSETKDWRDSVYGNINMSVKTLDIVIGCMVGFIILVLAVGAIKLFM